VAAGVRAENRSEEAEEKGAEEGRKGCQCLPKTSSGSGADRPDRAVEFPQQQPSLAPEQIECLPTGIG